MAVEMERRDSIKKKKVRPIRFGVDKETGELLTIERVVSGKACNCICPACKTSLEARKGDVRAHHFAHTANNDCLYGAEIALYHAFYEYLSQHKLFCLPKAELTFQSRKPAEIVSREQLMNLSDVQYNYDPSKYPPELYCYKDEKNCFRVILNIEDYFNNENYTTFRQIGKEQKVAVLVIDVPDIWEIMTAEDIANICESAGDKHWIYNRAVEKTREIFRNLAEKPPVFRGMNLCKMQKRKYKNVFVADKTDCVKCQYCYSIREGTFCLANSGVNHIEDFKRSEEERINQFYIENGLPPIKKITEYSCPKCGATMVRRVNKNGGVFAGCSMYFKNKCTGSYNVEPFTEQVIID